MASLQKALEPYDYGYDGWVHFFGASKSHPPIHYHYKSRKSQDVFKYISDCVCLKEDGHVHLGWLGGEVIMG